MTDILDRAGSIIAHGPHITYPSRAAAQHVRDVMKELAQALISAKLKMAEWQPIDTAPKDGTLIIVFRPNHTPTIPEVSMDQWMRLSDGAYHNWGYSNSECYPTHWRPMPAPPR